MKRLTASLLTVLLLSSCTPTANPATLGPVPVTASTAISTTTQSGPLTEPIPAGAGPAAQGQFDWKNATIYYAMTDRFANGNPANDESYGRQKVDAKGLDYATFHGGDFQGLTQKIEAGYFTDLGVNALWITAPYEQIHGFVAGGQGEFAHYAFHGYYPLDWTMTDRNFGTAAEFEALVDAAHAQGIRIILDVVLNHAGYHTLRDMSEYGFGKLKGINGDWQPGESERYDAFQQFIDYEEEAAWQRWWGSDWVRAGLPGYSRGGSDDYTMTLAGLPDVLTEAKDPVSLPPLLKTKWTQEAGEEFAPFRITAAANLRQDLNLPPAGYISAWLNAWVREFGIDGFRIDTAKHVEPAIWQNLKASADQALRDWRRDHPDKPGSEFSDSFFMMGEVWGKGIERNEYYDHGFDALLNFSFQGDRVDGPAYQLKTMSWIFQRYAATLKEQGTNAVSYLSSHDTRLYPRKKLKDGLTYLLLLPGAVEVFYGDESGRPYINTGSDLMMGTRGSMNWDSVDASVLEHFRKLGSFRARNVAVGAGTHTERSKSPLIFQRDYAADGIKNTVLVALDQPAAAILDVSGVFPDGSLVRDAYAMKGYRVSGGQVQVDTDPSGIVLLEQIEP